MDFRNTIKVAGGIGRDNSRNLLKETKTALIESGFAIIDKIGYMSKSFIHAKIDSLARAAKRLFSVSMNGVIDDQISKDSLKWNSSNHG